MGSKQSQLIGGPNEGEWAPQPPRRYRKMATRYAIMRKSGEGLAAVYLWHADMKYHYEKIVETSGGTEDVLRQLHEIEVPS